MQSTVPLTTDLVLIGGGHAHTLVLRMWGMRPVPGVRLTLIDPRPVAPYTGMLPGHVAGHYSADEIGIDLVRLARFAGARLILGAATALDPEARIVTVAQAGEGKGDRVVGFDVASLDIGITGDLPGVAGFAEHGIPVKPFVRFAKGWARYLESGQGDVTVIGAGLGGVELALAMKHRLGGVGRGRVIGRSGVTGVGTALADRLRVEMARQGVDLILGQAAEVTANAVVLSDGQRLPSAMTVGAGGATPQDWLAGTGLPLTEGFIDVRDTLQVVGHDHIFAAGDCARLTHALRPKAGVFAVRAAKPLVQNLRAAVRGQSMTTFRPQRNFLRLVSLGDRRAAAEKWPDLPILPVGAAIWRWKDRIDRRFMQRLTDLPAMATAPLPKDAAKGVSDHIAAPLCAGCGAKVGAGVLSAVLKDMPQVVRDDVLTGPGDDAGVLQIGGMRQVLTTDHLRAFTDDPGLLARIAAQHALGDIRAMGGEAQAALAQIVIPRSAERVQARMMAEIMQAAGDVFAAEGAVILGGHSTMGAEMTIGFSVTGLCPDAPITVAGARAGDVLLMTGRIGTGVLLAGEMQGKARGADIAALWSAMAAGQGAAAGALRKARAMTDITGFGLAGHLMAICRASGIGAEIDASAVPLYDGALVLSQSGVRSTLHEANRANAPLFGVESDRTALLHDPQTAGGLLAALDPSEAKATLAALRDRGVEAAVIGQMTDAPAGITLR